jgi:threonine dehydrogenase-like Zn-dependent dehydrogenase
MQALLGSVVAVSCFGAAYAAHIVFPVKTIQDGQLLLSQSTLGTINVYNRDTLQSEAKTTPELIKLYLARKANLEDVLEIVTKKSTIKEAYNALRAQEQTPETVFLIKAAEQNYGVKAEESTDENQAVQ